MVTIDTGGFFCDPHDRSAQHIERMYLRCNHGRIALLPGEGGREQAQGLAGAGGALEEGVFLLGRHNTKTARGGATRHKNAHRRTVWHIFRPGDGPTQQK